MLPRQALEVVQLHGWCRCTAVLRNVLNKVKDMAVCVRTQESAIHSEAMNEDSSQVSPPPLLSEHAPCQRLRDGIIVDAVAFDALCPACEIVFKSLVALWQVEEDEAEAISRATEVNSALEESEPATAAVSATAAVTAKVKAVSPSTSAQIPAFLGGENDTLPVSAPQDASTSMPFIRDEDMWTGYLDEIAGYGESGQELPEPGATQVCGAARAESPAMSMQGSEELAEGYLHHLAAMEAMLEEDFPQEEPCTELEASSTPPQSTPPPPHVIIKQLRDCPEEAYALSRHVTTADVLPIPEEHRYMGSASHGLLGREILHTVVFENEETGQYWSWLEDGKGKRIEHDRLHIPFHSPCEQARFLSVNFDRNERRKGRAPTQEFIDAFEGGLW